MKRHEIGTGRGNGGGRVSTDCERLPGPLERGENRRTTKSEQCIFWDHWRCNPRVHCTQFTMEYYALYYYTTTLYIYIYYFILYYYKIPFIML